MRDLTADLAICDAATAGPWDVKVAKMAQTIRVGNKHLLGGNVNFFDVIDAGTLSDATFIAAARTGWPEAIERCLAAETAATLLRAQIMETTAQMSADVAQLADDNQRLRQQLAELRSIVSTECPIGAFDIVTSLRAEMAHMREQMAVYSEDAWKYREFA